MAEYVTKEQVIDWYRPYGQTDEPIPFETLVSDLRDMKAADVAPVRHAYWVPEEHADQVSPTTIHRYTWYYCSECGRRLIGYKNPVDAPYCHCGCKMDLEG